MPVFDIAACHTFYSAYAAIYDDDLIRRTPRVFIRSRIISRTAISYAHAAPICRAGRPPGRRGRRKSKLASRYTSHFDAASLSLPVFAQELYLAR